MRHSSDINHPLISVIIPVYNCQQLLRSTVESILKSGLYDYEIIIIDDGSQDKTLQICNDLCYQYSFIQFIHQKNLGVSNARNRGIKEAKGEYILFFDADDSVAPNAYEECMDILRMNNPDILMYGMRFDYYKDGVCYREDELVCDWKGLFIKEQWLGYARVLYECNYLTPVWNKFFRYDIIQHHNIRFSEEMHIMEDCLFSLQCMERSETIYLLPQAIYCYRQTEDEGNAPRRLKMICSLSDYMQSFNDIEREWKEIVDSIYYMLLFIKVRNANVKEISIIAEDHRQCKYEPHTKREMWLSTQLLDRKYYKIYFYFLKSRIRHRIAVFAKSKGFYK